MIQCIFTLDYEIYGDGTGSLKELVYEPTEHLRRIFRGWNARFVTFVEVAELERIDSCGADDGLGLVKRQIRELQREDFEIGLHLHPQWANANFVRGSWELDFSEYNLCTLPQARIAEIVGGSLEYLRHVLDQPAFQPLSFRAGNWLFQPTRTAASILAQNGIKIDSSVFKGGLLHEHNLDYRPALRNGYYWPFDSDVNVPNPSGAWIEIPIYAELVPFWKMPTSKRLSFRNGFGTASAKRKSQLNRVADFLRLRYPLKFDFCRMTLKELTAMVERVVREDQAKPELFRPMVAIGHTKDFIDPQTVESFLAFLNAKQIAVSTFDTSYSTLSQNKREVVNVN
jgi:hypothetical protein